MQLVPYILVLVSAVTHGIWNFLAKRADDKDVFIGLSKLSEAVLFLIPFIFLLVTVGVQLDTWLLFVRIAAIFVFLNYPKLNILSGYAAKNTSSSVFLAHRTLAFTDSTDNNFPPVNLASNSINKENVTVTAVKVNEHGS